MAIPGYQDFMLPLLRCSADGAEFSIATATDRMAEEFRLSEQDRSEMLPSGIEPRVRNRVTWAAYYMFRAGLLERPGRGRYRLSDRGRAVLNDPPDRINDAYLQRYPEFVSFYKPKPNAADDAEQLEGGSLPAAATPSERLEVAYAELRAALAAELLERVRGAAPAFFERLVVELLVKMGYGGSQAELAGSVTGGSGDSGIDGIIKEDKLGLDVIYLQAKRWKEGIKVSRPEVQAFAGSLEGERANKGVFITTSSFTDEAHQYVRKIGKRIILIDGEHLAELMIEHDVGVAVEKAYLVKRVDGDYFEEG